MYRKNNVCILTPNNFMNALKKYDHLFVKFSSKECKECIYWQPEFNEVANAL